MIRPRGRGRDLVHRVWLCVGAVWLISLVAATHAMLRYETRPGSFSTATIHWPDALRRDPTRAALVMVVHPNCPCSGSSVAELAVLMRDCPTLSAYVVFDRPTGLNVDSSSTQLWRSTADIPGVTPIRDDTGAITGQLHAETSGEVFFFDADGALRFRGGITESRGHVGDNDGRDSIESLMRSHGSRLARTPVYGCPLQAKPDGCPLQAKPNVCQFPAKPD